MASQYCSSAMSLAARVRTSVSRRAISSSVSGSRAVGSLQPAVATLRGADCAGTAVGGSLFAALVVGLETGLARAGLNVLRGRLDSYSARLRGLPRTS